MKRKSYNINYDAIKKAIKDKQIFLIGRPSVVGKLTQLDLSRCPCCGRAIDPIGSAANVVVNQQKEVLPYVIIDGSSGAVIGGKAGDTYKFGMLGDKCEGKFFEKLGLPEYHTLRQAFVEKLIKKIKA